MIFDFINNKKNSLYLIYKNLFKKNLKKIIYLKNLQNPFSLI